MGNTLPNQISKKKIFRVNLTLSILLLTLITVGPFAHVKIENAVLTWILSIYILFNLMASSIRLYKKSTNNILVNLFLALILMNILRSFIIAQTYWEYKGTIGISFAMLLSFCFYSFVDTNYLQQFFYTYFKYVFPLFIIYLFNIAKDAYGFYLAPVSFFLLFFPYLTKKWRIIFIVVCIFIVISDLGARSNVIKFSIPLVFMSLYYFRNWISLRLFNIIHTILMVIPFVFLFLGTSGTFNVFKIQNYLKPSTSITYKKTGESLVGDTRTFLYVELFETMQKYHSWTWGRSFAKGSESKYFGKELKFESGSIERRQSEVAILNILLNMGIVGTLLYFLIFLFASWLAINKSKNHIIKILGLYLAFRWVYAWVEDVNSFSLTYLSIWVLIGMCFSKSFRMMNNTELKLWVRGVFKKHKLVRIN